MNNETRILSVVMITYSHEKFIEEAINGVLMQNCSFDFELIVANDCSPDNTDIIIQAIIENHPKGNKIKYLNRKKNIGMLPNFISALQSATGKYIALCEGDDYWTDPYKLQKQVDFLESESHFTMSFHSVEVKNEIEEINYQYPIPNKDVLSFKNVLFKHYIPTCSIVYRKDALPNPLPCWFNKCKMGDIPLELMLADKGKVKFFNEKMGIYRKNDKSITQNIGHIQQGRKAYDYLYKNLRSHFGSKYFVLFSIVILKNKLGFIKDLLGLNTSIK